VDRAGEHTGELLAEEHGRFRVTAEDHVRDVFGALPGVQDVLAHELRRVTVEAF
jgi:hypothetical protein